MMNGDLQNIFADAIRECAIGDALGGPRDFINSMDGLLEKVGPDVEVAWHPAGARTNDTQMSPNASYDLPQADVNARSSVGFQERCWESRT